MKIPARTALALAAAPLLCTALAPTPAAAAQPAAGPWKDRAVHTYDALQKHLYQGADNHGLYQEKTPRQSADNAHSYLWPMREAAAATVDMAGLPGTGEHYTADAAERFATLELYFEPRDGRPGYDSYLPAPLGQGGDVFYDDNSVVGLSLLDQYTSTGNPTYLRRAELTFDIVSRGWDDDPAKECPGGMDWVDSPANTMRAANVTGLAAELAARLHQETHQSRYLTSAQKWYEWNWSCLRESPGLYRNSRGDDETVDPTLWTYNSGAMIGTATTLYQVTGDRSYLKRAVQDADGSLAYWKQGERLHDQPAIFNAIYFDNLRILSGVHPGQAYLQVEKAYAERTWKENRDPSNGLFRFQPSGGGDYDAAAPAETLEQSAMVQIFAGLATDGS
ncbi:glycoside hydrolase family 76 protein [Streptomyces sp. NPDC050529]|uniref:glycoside hydrolase family 76 protein n=1 Tax=unclassified Streptomyces TaxID=2593676 RepID=UPI002DD8BA02|nr:glycoside hydrolase family 76 protein [Streptomyces sp. NBC_01022]WRZ78781.1 glycoside hydrolase family 76 protein [Streptomyces sp. NBC_01022]WRZ86898.1 glycoside hydrolase family 76 protein [Streptomyces sp. NBC_01022]